jgi:hypothetical protein
MANVIPSRIGQINGAGDPLAIFLKVFSGRVLTTFKRLAAFRERHLVQTIASGKSAQFPATGILTAMNHNPGDEIIGEILNNAEKDINIEGKKIASVFIADIDQLMNHYDYSSIVNEQIAQALSKQYDGDVSRVIMLAARQTNPNVKGVFLNDTLNSVEVNPAFQIDGAAIVNGIIDASVAFDQRDIPFDDRYVALRPVQYALAVKDGRVLDRRFGNEDNGSLKDLTIKSVANMDLFKSNNYAATNDYSGFNGGVNPLQPTQRQHDYSTSEWIAFHKSAAGTVALTDMSMETWWDPRRQGNQVLGKYICGHDWLRPESAFEGQSANPAG